MKVLKEDKPIKKGNDVVGYEHIEAGRIQIIEVDDNISFAKIIDTKEDFKQGDKVIENKCLK